MTNSRITDVEVLEARFPVVLLKFEAREMTGGNGRNKGGEGVVRRTLFLEDVECSILTGEEEHPKTIDWSVCVENEFIVHICRAGCTVYIWSTGQTFGNAQVKGRFPLLG